MENTVIVAFHHKKRNTWLDMEIPLDISANELIYGLNKGLICRMWRNVICVRKIQERCCVETGCWNRSDCAMVRLYILTDKSRGYK